NFLGFNVSDFPKPQGKDRFDEVAKDAPKFEFQVVLRELTGPEPKASYQQRNSVNSQTHEGTKIEAYCGYDRDEIAPGHGFLSTRTNRRHIYGGGEYHPQDVYIGKRVNGKIQASLFFRDVGSHNTAPHALAIDSKDQCHFAVADVDMGQNN